MYVNLKPIILFSCKKCISIGKKIGLPEMFLLFPRPLFPPSLCSFWSHLPPLHPNSYRICLDLGSILVGLLLLVLVRQGFWYFCSFPMQLGFLYSYPPPSPVSSSFLVPSCHPVFILFCSTSSLLSSWSHFPPLRL